MRVLFTMRQALLLPVMTVIGFTSLACRSEEDKLLDNLRSSKVFYTDGTSTITCGGPVSVRGWANDWQRRGVDLFKLYLEQKADESVRLSLAYFLVMAENRDYLEWGNRHREELIAQHEFMVWAHVLRDKEGESVSASHREAMANVLAHLSLPYGRLAVAVERLRRGERERAVQLLLDVMSHPVWSHEAFMLLEQMDRASLERFVVPYLESESIRGVQAANLLANTPSMSEMRARAVGHLQRLARSQDKQIADAATNVLQYHLTTRPE